MKRAILIAILCGIVSTSFAGTPSFQGLGHLPVSEGITPRSWANIYNGIWEIPV
jgi:hypothetical protein